MIPILCSINKEYENIYDTFAKYTYTKYHLYDSFVLYPNMLDTYKNSLKGFCSESYLRYRQQHILYILSHLNKYSHHKFILSIDADVLFLKNFASEVLNITNYDNNYHVYLSRDSDSQPQIPNLGFMILRNCNETKEFLKDIHSYLSNGNLNCDQLYSNLIQNIGYNKYKLALLDNRLFIHNNSSLQIAQSRIMRGGCLFHATSTANIYDKAYALSNIMRWIHQNNL